jgi:hypothetical protein
MREYRTSGEVRGVPGNRHSYRGGTKKIMNNKQRQMKERTVLASLFAAVVLSIKICSDFVGFNKLHPATPLKTFNEVVAEWPLLLGIGVFAFAASWLWLASQEKTYVICSGCQKMTEKNKRNSLTCLECGATLENLEGFYDRHLEKSPNKDARPD